MKTLLLILIFWLFPVFLGAGAGKSYKLNLDSSDFCYLFIPAFNWIQLIIIISMALEKYTKEN